MQVKLKQPRRVIDGDRDGRTPIEAITQSATTKIKQATGEVFEEYLGSKIQTKDSAKEEKRADLFHRNSIYILRSRVTFL